MKLRNKKTGEIKEWDYVCALTESNPGEIWDSDTYNSLAELNAEWEDVEDVGSIELIKERIGIADNKIITAKVVQGKVPMSEEPTIEEQLKKLIELLEKREKEKTSPIWLTARSYYAKKKNDSEEEE